MQIGNAKVKESKKIYNMIDGIPIWQHLKNMEIEDSKMILISSDYGKIGEILGKRILNRLTAKGGILDKIFPGITIVSVHRLPKLRVLNGKKIEMGDLILEIDYFRESDSIFGKKIILFEIKCGGFQIEQNQIRRYSHMINNPGEYYHKADELKVFFMIFYTIDTIKGFADYSISEFDKNIAKKVIESVPTEEWDGKFNSYDNTYSKIKSGMTFIFG